MNALLIGTYKAEAAMATAFVAVKLGTATDEVNLAGNGEAAIGVIQNTAAAAGDQVSVAMLGTTWVVANAAIAKGASVNSAASTGMVDEAGDKEYALGIALEAATAQDDLIPILLTPGNNATA
jgi:hypothetical protein